MVPADTDDIAHDYEVLLSELRTYNPELLDKRRVLAVTKSDIIDQELQELLTPTLPTDVPTIFISSVTGYNIAPLKDLLWQALTEGQDGTDTAHAAHHDKTLDGLHDELAAEGEDMDLVILDDDDIEDFEDFEDLDDADEQSAT